MLRSAKAMLTEMHDTGLSEADISTLVGISQVQVHRLRHGKRSDPKMSTWDKVFHAYIKWRKDSQEELVRPKAAPTPLDSQPA